MKGPFLLAAAAVLSASVLTAAEWQTGAGYRRTELPVPNSGKAGFTLLPTATTGIAFSNTLAQSLALTNHIYQDGSGVAAGDIDGDGWCDLYFCAIDGRNSLYRNLGNWRFEDITEPGVACAGLHSTGAVFADLDGDGDLDLIVNTAGNGTLIFLNDGHGHFTKAPLILNPRKGAQSLALADTDGDGYLDLYVVNYRLSALMDLLDGGRFTFKMVNGKQTVETFNGRPVTDPDLADRFTIGPRGDFQENGEPDVLYRNVGGTNFVVVPFTGGNFLDEDGKPLAKPPPDWGLSAMFRDINGDGLPDLYVCNDFQSPDRFWLNQGSNHFRLLPRLAQRKTSISSMGLDFADINRDGFDDFLVVDMMSRQHSLRMRVLSATYAPSHPLGYFEDRPQYELNTLFLNRGDNTFAEIAQLSGLEAAEWAWSCIFLDVDLDGWEDVLVANGMEHDGRDLDSLAQLKKLRAGRQPSATELKQARALFPRQAEGNLVFRNQGDLTFQELSHQWGFDWKGVSSAMALADLDNDGDLDVVVNTLNGPALLYRNNSPAPRVAVRLKGLPPNTRGIGSRIAVSGGPVPLQTQEMICGGRYLSSDDPMRVFAAGTTSNKLALEISWRSGRRSFIANVTPNFLYEVDEASAHEIPSTTSNRSLGPLKTQSQENVNLAPLFQDVTDRLRHVHHEDPFDDFARQPLLPNKLSQLGPGVAWFDIDGDGSDDLIIGSGKGGALGIYFNKGTNGFQPSVAPSLSIPVARDLTTILGWRPSTNQALLLAGRANYEDGETNGPAVRKYDLVANTVDDTLTNAESSIGPLAIGALDGDGHFALFVGGRVLPARYPEPPTSRIYLYESNTFKLYQELNTIGMVSGALWSDLNGDGYPELILACEWGPLRIFRNDHGKLIPWDVPLTWPAPIIPSTPNRQPSTSLATISQLLGWWNGVTVGDFDGDGRLDLAASNWGRNTKYEAHRIQPLTLYYGDLRGDGTMQQLEAYYDPALQKIVPALQLNPLANSLPFLLQRFSSHQAYSIASVNDLLGDSFSASKRLEANWLESTIFLNRGDHFEVRVLPVEAQISPAFGICVADFDGDGNEDLFLAQNFFATQPETPRYDAGRGLLLRGDGKGGFQAMPGSRSGLEIYGEQRGAAVCDFDGDGRPDLVVTQNGAATKLYRNATGKPGLRVRLKGDSTNPQAVGAVMRLKTGNRGGLAREVHCGSGYWSQDSAIQVLATPEPPTQIEVHWPGGKTTTNPVPNNAIEIVISPDGDLTTAQ